MTILDKIQAIAEAACPGYAFIFDYNRMFNVTADNQAFPCILMEEYYSGRHARRYGWRKTVTVELHFMQLASFQGVATAREDVREEMEANAVIPFVDALNADGYFGQVEEFRIDPEPALFDANAVGLLVTIELSVNRCALDNPHPQPNNA